MRTPRLTLISSILLIAALACNFGGAGQKTAVPSATSPATAAPTAVATPAEAGMILLNEILFRPPEGGHQFVELKNVGNAVSLNGLRLSNEKGETYTLPAGLRPLASDAQLLIIFDGQNTFDGATLHADRTSFLNPDSGFVELAASDGALLDRVAWGASQPDSVNLSRGGRVPEIVPGTSIGRFPLSTEIGSWEWVTLSPQQSTPASPNPQPGVQAMLPLNGAIFEQPEVRLSWYTVAGTGEYRIQVSTDPSFATIIEEDVLPAPGSNALTMLSLTTGPLAPGNYYWRVQVVAADGAAADFSPTSAFEVKQAVSAKPAAQVEGGTVLEVPHFFQSKDTSMLVMEGPAETGEDAWDQPYEDPGPNGPYCARATVAMINAFYGGNLSQDRIGYEAFKDLKDGPEFDLIVRGMFDNEIQAALEFALNAEPTRKFAWREGEDAFWAEVVGEIDAGRPVFTTDYDHAWATIGYRQDGNGRYLIFNDPAVGRYEWNLDDKAHQPLGPEILDAYWVLPPREDAGPAVDEPEVHLDTDGDGMVDFDETDRFHTDPNDPDTDKDKVPDKAEVRASVWEHPWGYAYQLGFIGRDFNAITRPEAVTGTYLDALRGRDFDADGLPMELDEDSDGGGCFDGMEDIDHDGKYALEGETDNFFVRDDTCLRGTYLWRSDMTHQSSDTTFHNDWEVNAKFSVKPVEGGRLKGLAQFTYTEEDQAVDNVCPGTFSIRLVWGAELEGEFYEEPFEGTRVSIRTPDRAPTYLFHWAGPCSEFSEPFEVQMAWGEFGVSGILVDDVFDQRTDYQPFPGYTGEWYSIVHLEQSQNK